MRTIYIKCGGLMEDPDWHWEVFGEGNGNTLAEVMEDFLSRNEGYRSCYDPESCTYWGWQLSLTPGG